MAPFLTEAEHGLRNDFCFFDGFMFLILLLLNYTDEELLNSKNIPSIFVQWQGNSIFEAELDFY